MFSCIFPQKLQRYIRDRGLVIQAASQAAEATAQMTCGTMALRTDLRCMTRCRSCSALQCNSSCRSWGLTCGAWDVDVASLPEMSWGSKPFLGAENDLWFILIQGLASDLHSDGFGFLCWDHLQVLGTSKAIDEETSHRGEPDPAPTLTWTPQVVEDPRNFIFDFLFPVTL